MSKQHTHGVDHNKYIIVCGDDIPKSEFISKIVYGIPIRKHTFGAEVSSIRLSQYNDIKIYFIEFGTKYPIQNPSELIKGSLFVLEFRLNGRPNNIYGEFIRMENTRRRASNMKVLDTIVINNYNNTMSSNVIDIIYNNI